MAKAYEDPVLPSLNDEQEWRFEIERGIAKRGERLEAERNVDVARSQEDHAKERNLLPDREQAKIRVVSEDHATFTLRAVEDGRVRRPRERHLVDGTDGDTLLPERINELGSDVLIRQQTEVQRVHAETGRSHVRSLLTRLAANRNAAASPSEVNWG